jgi:hypothetical protein
MRRPTLSRLTLLAIAAAAIGVTLGFGAHEGNDGPSLRADATVAGRAYGQGNLAAVVRPETDRGGSVWARRNLAPESSFLVASIVLVGVALHASGQARRAATARSRRASVVPLRTAVGLRAPPQALVFAPNA